jgi:RimJ/RimL family protein N-acetyltransferase
MRVTLEPFQSTRDLHLLARWLNEPHVCKWWGDPEGNFADAKERSPESHALIDVNGKPVGYLRWQRVSLPALAALGITDIPESSIDIDILIGEQGFVGKGIGPRALRLLLDHLRADPTISLAGMSTEVGNYAAIRAYEKAGFQRRHRYFDPEYGESWIMVIEFTAG